MGFLSMMRGFSALALAAAIAPFLFFGLLVMMVLGVATVTMGPLVFAFISWIMLSKWSRRARAEHAKSDVLEARIVREASPSYPVEAYTPPVHFDLLLSAKQDIGRMIGASGAISDAAISKQFRALALKADTILTLVIKEPSKLGLARRFFASYLPRAADLAEGYHRLDDGNLAHSNRRTKLIDVLYRLEQAMQESEQELSSPELARIDADMKILSEDLKGYRSTPLFTQPSDPILNRVDDIIKRAKKKK